MAHASSFCSVAMMLHDITSVERPKEGSYPVQVASFSVSKDRDLPIWVQLQEP